MTIKINIILAVCLLTVGPLAKDEVGCEVITEEPVGCSIDNILHHSKNNVLDVEPSVVREKNDIAKKNINISKQLHTVAVVHDKHEVLIQRHPTHDTPSCPPFCIEPLSIEGVRTVAELATLAFIKKIEEKKSRLLIDIRKSKLYKQSTIPGAINLPFSMLADESIYQEEVLKLLGAKKIVNKQSKERWYFKDTPSLLIFGQNASSSGASSSIKKLIELGYPKAKLLYYRGGIDSWKAMGLTTI